MKTLAMGRRLPKTLWLGLCAGVLALGCEIEIESEDDVYHEPLSTPDGATPWLEPPSGVYPRVTPEPEPDIYPALLVLDPTIVQGPLASNANPDAPFSFRTQLEWLAGAGDPFELARDWLLEWANVRELGAARAPVTPRPEARDRLLDGWVAASVPAGSGYAAAGATLDARASATADFRVAPFQLIAIVNRVDLASEPCAAGGGELRYVYSAVDPVSDELLDMTVIVEVPYPSTRSAADWARQWQEAAWAVGQPEYTAGLEQLAREVLAEADPLRVRVQSNELAFGPTWEMRQFVLQVEGQRLALRQAPLEFTPRADADPARLAEHLLAHADEIRTGRAALPEELRAGAAEIGDPTFSWSVLGVSEGLRRAFSAQTCNGCHGGDAKTLPFRHIAPSTQREQPARMSRFLYDPDAPEDELRRRSDVLDRWSQTVCEPNIEDGTYP